ncbi:ECF transporter S component [Velocimicrobium porci]|uniref:ECF transporter S component n=1 Tax=Velocimicrobium porci TaxID=2606634 RepID=A0A6L5XZ26_9FIRM|nr:ECF transporter S component [Velocimicrobium porci]MSS63964.1 ECF transporter S component [Velocimicrobium porci]
MKKKNFEVTQMVQLAMLIAILVILTATQLGFINYGVVSITILHIPVIIGSILMGPFYGGLLGLTFGIISMTNATLRGATPVDMMFSPIVSGLPAQSFIMCIIPRVILGIVPSVFYSKFQKVIKKPYIRLALSAALSTMIHTILVLSCLYFMFFTDMNFTEVLKGIFLTVIGVNGLLEMLSAVIICSAVCIPLLTYTRSLKTN